VGGTSTSGVGGTIAVWWWDLASSRRRVAVGYIGENGLLPNVPYTANSHGELAPKERQWPTIPEPIRGRPFPAAGVPRPDGPEDWPQTGQE
jgi:hypothetical protein